MSTTADAPNASSDPAATIEIEIWADLICPWCYLGGNRLADAIEEAGLADRVQVRLRSFELDPNASPEQMSIAESFEATRGVPREQFEQMEGGVRDLAVGEGLEYTIERPVASTLDVHRVLRLADETGRSWELFTALQHGYFAGRLNPFDADDLVAAAVEVGLSGEEVRAVLAGERFTDEVRRDEAEGREIGVTGVPFVVFDGRLAAPGALSAEQYAEVLAQLAG